MVKNITKYIKYSMEPCRKQLKQDAFESAKNYFAKLPRVRSTVDQWIAYQQAYISAYRHTYAKNKLKDWRNA